MFFLIVDDDELSRELLALLLVAEGHEIELAVSGEEALAKVCKFVPDVLLTDLQMPGLAGNELGKALREAIPTRTVLLAMSGSRPPERSFESYDGFLLKPFSMDELRATIDAPTANGVNSNRRSTSDVLYYALEAESGAKLSALNEDVYSKLSDSMPAAQLRQMFDMCITDARVRIEQMAELVAAGDDIGYRAAAHTIKGGCGFIGATELYCLAETAEHDGLNAKLGNTIGTNRAAATLDQFSSACERLERILEQRARD